MTFDQLREIFPHADLALLLECVDPMNEALEEFGIDTPKRQAAFLAQLAHESGGLRYWVEHSDGMQYEGREQLGNYYPGDGPRYKGRGPMQITGRKNYGLCGDALGVDLIEYPQILEKPAAGLRAAAWFWTQGAGLNLSKRAREACAPGCNLNDYADAGDIEAITLAINGGLNGFDDRKAHYARISQVLGVA